MQISDSGNYLWTDHYMLFLLLVVSSGYFINIFLYNKIKLKNINLIKPRILTKLTYSSSRK